MSLLRRVRLRLCRWLCPKDAEVIDYLEPLPSYTALQALAAVTDTRTWGGPTATLAGASTTIFVNSKRKPLWSRLLRFFRCRWAG